jgi:uncharacterized protein YbbC (DUF1343 family)
LQGRIRSARACCLKLDRGIGIALNKLRKFDDRLRIMRRLLLFFTALLAFVSVSAQNHLYVTIDDLQVGAERFEVYIDELKAADGVAVVANHTSMVRFDNERMHLVDALLAQGVKVKRVFAPEHGFRGKADAGEKVESGKDAKTGLPVVSLYGSHKKPTPEDLSGVEIVVFDIQDVGARFYTYISTMTYVMEACAEQGKAVWVLDRPNPNGFYVDGPMLQPEFSSFVGMLPIPVVHGMTVAELAQMINGEAWLKDGLQCELNVITCDGWNRNDVYILPEKPSPNLPTITSILLYPSLCFFEGTGFSVGRGTDQPFEVFGHPNMSVGSFMFVPKPTDGAKHPKHEGVPCLGWDLSEIGAERVKEKESLILDWLINAYRDFPQKEKFFLENGFFDKLAGTDALRKQIIAGLTAEEIRSGWQQELSAFKAQRKAYLLYP